MSEQQFDVVVIGGGPGGYVAAIRAAQLGLKTACIESRGALGGTCLNVGCIPSKALLQSTEAYHSSLHKNKDLGVVYEKVSFDLAQIHKHKNTTVKQLTGGVEMLLKKNKITYIKGHGSFLEPGRIQVSGDDEQVVQAKHVIVATGSKPIELPIAKFDEKQVVSSTGALDFDQVPDHLVVIGGGVIGLELGSVWARLGAKVSVIEATKSILPAMDQDVVRVLKKTLAKEGLEFYEDTKFTELKKKGKKLTVLAKRKDETVELSADKLLVAVGRRPNTDGLGLDKIGLATDDKGRIPVDDHYRTQVDGVYAIGDVIEGLMLAHKAEEEGVACAEILAGKPGHVNYQAIPNVVYTWPEVATVGLSEKDCKDQGLEFKTGRFSFAANGRAKAMGEKDGFVKIIADKKTDRMLGASIVGPNASELIAELAIATEYAASAEDVARSVHAHPTLAEVIKEAALAVDKRALHG